MTDLGVSADVRAPILDNSAAVNSWIYTHVSDAAKREAVGRIAPLFPRYFPRRSIPLPRRRGTNGGKPRGATEWRSRKTSTK